MVIAKAARLAITVREREARDGGDAVREDQAAPAAAVGLTRMSCAVDVHLPDIQSLVAGPAGATAAPALRPSRIKAARAFVRGLAPSVTRADAHAGPGTGRLGQRRL